MITSYVDPQRNLLYLSLVGPLDGRGADELVAEYHERHEPELRRCVLDLGNADGTDEDGLAVLNRLSLLAQVDGVEFSLVAGGSGAVVEAARRYWVPVVDHADLPLAS